MKYIASAFVALFLLIFAGTFAVSHVKAASLTNPQVQAIIGLLQSFGADQNTVNKVYATLTGSSYGHSNGYNTSCAAITKSLYKGLSDAQTEGQVSALQRSLGITPSGYFDAQTYQTVANFQQQNGIAPITGGVGPLTRAALARRCGGTVYPYPTNGTVSITSVSGPNALSVNQSGTWTVSTNAQYGAYVNVSVRWGDENYYGYAAGAPMAATVQSQNTFSHSYTQAGVYTITFTATDNTGRANTATAQVTVGQGSGCTNYYCSAPTISSISPTQGPVGAQVTIYGSGFTNDNTVHFGQGGAKHVASYNGTQLSFTIPERVGGCSFYGETLPILCFAADPLTAPGSYPVSVQNANGQSNTLNFTVTSTATTNGTIRVTAPAPGAQFVRGQDMEIMWDIANMAISNSSSFVLDLYMQNGTKVGTIAIPSNGASSYLWHIPSFPQNYFCTMQYPNGLCGANIPTGQYYVVVTATTNPFDSTAAPYANGRSGTFTITQQ